MNRKSIFVFLLVSVLVFPCLCLGQDFEIDLEKIADYLVLPKKEAEMIILTIPDKITEKWIEITASSFVDWREQVILMMIRRGMQVDVFNYIFLELPKEMGTKLIKAIYKIAVIINSPDKVPTLLDEFEKYTVEEAKRVGIEWLLQREIKVSTGNLKLSYPSYKGDWQNVIFSYILAYQPLEFDMAMIGIEIYSADFIDPVQSNWLYPWEGGVEEKIPPFILRIKGRVWEDFSSGTFLWVEKPIIEIDFPEEVPNFKFEELPFVDKIRQEIKEKEEVAKKIIEGLKDFGRGVVRETGEIINKTWDAAENAFEKLKLVLDEYNPFATGTNTSLLEQELKQIEEPEQEEISDLAMEEGMTIEDIFKELEQPFQEKEVLQENFSEEPEILEPEIITPELNYSYIQEQLNNIAEQIDIISRRIAQLTSISGQKLVAGEFTEKEQEPEEVSEETEPEQEIEEEVIKDIVFCEIKNTDSPNRNKIIINEVAWMGTGNSSYDEWIELRNIKNEPVDISGWQLQSKKQNIKIIFEENNIISNRELYLLERTDESTVPWKTADLIYKGNLNNSDDGLYLFNKNCELEDMVLANPDWPAGDSGGKRSMERGGSISWHTFSMGCLQKVCGTPKSDNSRPSEQIVISLPANGEDSPPSYCSQEDLSEPFYSPVIINEIAWMGTENSSNDEWIELKNISENSVSLADWQLLDMTLQIKIVFDSSDSIEPGEFYLLERTNDDSIPFILADKIYTGPLSNSNESLQLFDQDCNLIDEALADPDWLAGNNEQKKSMERGGDLAWHTFSGKMQDGIFGTPKAENSVPQPQAPNQILDLVIDDQSSQNRVILNWTAPQDLDSQIEQLSYDIRYSFEEITQENWENAFQIEDEPQVQDAGNIQSYTFWPLNYEKTYYFGIKTLDLENNSLISNIISFQTGSGPDSFTWPQFQKDAQKTNRILIPGPESPDNNKIIHENPVRDIVIGAEGIIYFSSIDNIYSISPDLTQKKALRQENAAALAVGKDGTIFAVSDKIIAIDQLGNKIWDYNFSYTYEGLKPAVFEDKVYVLNKCEGFTGFSLFCFNLFGDLEWVFDTESLIFHQNPDFSCNQVGFSGVYYSSPAIAQDGTIYFGDNKDLYAVLPAGIFEWKTDFEEGRIITPSVGQDGTIYVLKSGNLLALNPKDGEIIWDTGTSLKDDLGLAIGSDGKLYISGYTLGSGRLYSINPVDGSILTTFSPTEPNIFWGQPSVPLLTQDKLFVLINYTGGSVIKAFDYGGNEIWNWDFYLNLFVKNLILNSNGVLLIPGQKLIAILF